MLQHRGERRYFLDLVCRDDFYCLGHGTREVSYMEVLKWHDEMQFMRK